MMEQKTSPASSPELESPDLYINRELSWIEFNRRVFEQACDARHPLLERVKFISIFDTNLDEFIMIRLAGLKDQVASRASVRSPDGRSAEQQLTAIRQRLAPLIQEVCQYWQTELLPLLAEQHIHILDYEQLDTHQQDAMREYFEREVFPVLTPLAVDAAHPFPHISNRSLNLAVVIADPGHGELFARVKIPSSLPRLVPVPTSSEESQAVTFVWLEQLVATHIYQLFPGYDVWETYPFRVLRDADIELQEEDAADLLEYIEQEVRERRFGMVVNLTVNPSMPQRIRSLLLHNLEIEEEDLTVVDGPLGMGDVMELLALDRPELKDTPFVPRVPSILRKSADVHNVDLFGVIQRHDILLHHPYDGFGTVVDFIRTAAHDPQVLAIKQTLYRVGTNAPVVTALLEAIENGKQVAVLVELKARFDEDNNIVWAKKLERAGVHVVYSPTGLKTHAKLALVVRREEQGLRRYVHLGTGNYNATSARIYEDLGLLSCKEDICADVTALFNALTGHSRQSNYRKLLVAPVHLRRGIAERIEREIELHKQFGNGHLIFKLNAIIDPPMVTLLYRAAQEGVKVDLIVRGMCSVRPGIPGISENMRVRSIVGRFLEHSRVYYFENNGNAEIFLGSADLMQRNLNSRVEALFPLEQLPMREAIREKMLKPLLADTVNAYELHEDGCYTKVHPEEGMPPFDSQAWFITHPLFEAADDENPETAISAIPSRA
jgi:polyphosphate kinase